MNKRKIAVQHSHLTEITITIQIISNNSFWRLTICIHLMILNKMSITILNPSFINNLNNKIREIITLIIIINKVIKIIINNNSKTIRTKMAMQFLRTQLYIEQTQVK